MAPFQWSLTGFRAHIGRPSFVGSFWRMSKPFLDALDERVTLQELMPKNAAREISGVLTGVEQLDRIIRGLQQGNLIIVTGPRGIGKTDFALQVALRGAEQTRTLFFSLQVATHLLADQYLGITDDFSRPPDRSPGYFWGIAAGTVDLKLEIADEPRMKIGRICDSAFTAAREERLGLIVIDHLELVRADSNYDDPVDDLDEIARVLKQLARELRCPVLATSQSPVSQGTLTLSALREQNTITAHADVVAILHPGPGASIATGDIRATVIKNRNGTTGTTDGPVLNPNTRDCR